MLAYRSLDRSLIDWPHLSANSLACVGNGDQLPPAILLTRAALDITRALDAIYEARKIVLCEQYGPLQLEWPEAIFAGALDLQQYVVPAERRQTGRLQRLLDQRESQLLCLHQACPGADHCVAWGIGHGASLQVYAHASSLTDECNCIKLHALAFEWTTS